MSRVAIVTGAGSGIGAATAQILADNGMDLVLVGRRPEPLEAVLANVGGGIIVAADVGERSAPGLIVERALDAFGRIDVLVNNAAVIHTGLLPSVTRESFERHYAVNVGGPLFLVTAALSALQRSDDAAVVNISSSVGSIIKSGNTLYGSTKAALEYLTRAWAHELAGDGIRVNCIAPGPVDTPIHATYSDDLEATYADLARRIPLQRMGTSEDIARWVWLLVSSDSRWTTGNVIHVDGGQVLGPPG